MVRGGGFLYRLSDYDLHKNDSAAWSWEVISEFFDILKDTVREKYACECWLYETRA
jgi:hypothetical protein